MKTHSDTQVVVWLILWHDADNKKELGKVLIKAARERGISNIEDGEEVDYLLESTHVALALECYHGDNVDDFMTEHNLWRGEDINNPSSAVMSYNL